MSGTDDDGIGRGADVNDSRGRICEVCQMGGHVGSAHSVDSPRGCIVSPQRSLVVWFAHHAEEMGMRS